MSSGMSLYIHALAHIRRFFGTFFFFQSYISLFMLSYYSSFHVSVKLCMQYFVLKFARWVVGFKRISVPQTMRIDIYSSSCRHSALVWI